MRGLARRRGAHYHRAGARRQTMTEAARQPDRAMVAELRVPVAPGVAPTPSGAMAIPPRCRPSRPRAASNLRL
jgi:hypothetical protein